MKWVKIWVLISTVLLCGATSLYAGQTTVTWPSSADALLVQEISQRAGIATTQELLQIVIREFLASITSRQKQETNTQLLKDFRSQRTSQATRDAVKALLKE